MRQRTTALQGAWSSFGVWPRFYAKVINYNECLSDLPKQDLWDFNASKGNCSCEDCTIEAFLIFL